jgi:hypothetical protein
VQAVWGLVLQDGVYIPGVVAVNESLSRLLLRGKARRVSETEQSSR